MSTYRLLILDLDGTTVKSSQKAMPSQRVIDAVKAAQTHLKVAIATGRPRPFTQEIIEALDITGPSVFNGGAEIIDTVSGEKLHEQLISAESIRETLAITSTFDIDVYTDENQYDVAIKSPEQVIKPAAKLFIDSMKTSDAVHLIEELESVKGISAHMTTSWGKGDIIDIHIVHEHATKRYGVEKLMEILGVSKEEVIAIGDSYNDLPMLEAAGFKVAMGNAPDEVKAVADYVTLSLDDDGVAVAIEKFITN